MFATDGHTLTDWFTIYYFHPLCGQLEAFSCFSIWHQHLFSPRKVGVVVLGTGEWKYACTWPYRHDWISAGTEIEFKVLREERSLGIASILGEILGVTS